MIKCRFRLAFTMVELAVVIAIVGVVAAMLLPALSAFKKKSQQTKCVSNAKQIGVALSLYANDSRGLMPLCRGWASLGGKDGGYSEVGQYRRMTNKPLYRYQGDPEIFRCPEDGGDKMAKKGIGVVVTNCYAHYGTSYLAPWMYNRMGIKAVYGAAADPKGAPSMSQSDIAVSAANKILLGDWIYHIERQVGEGKTIWHISKGKPTLVMLFGDGHAQNWNFPASTDQELLKIADQTPDANNSHW